jgi:hypothetical protein
VTEAEAAQAIAKGQRLLPNDSHNVFSHDSASSFGLQAHMFYRQAGMFIEYLKESNPEAFRLFLTDVERGRPFKAAFEQSYRISLDTAWLGFVKSLSSLQRNVVGS